MKKMFKVLFLLGVFGSVLSLILALAAKSYFTNRASDKAQGIVVRAMENSGGILLMTKFLRLRRIFIILLRRVNHLTFFGFVCALI